VTASARYEAFVESLQDVARQVVTFGLHVHVGVESGDKAVLICDRLVRHLPLLLALSANSPFWDGGPTGLHSSRSKVLEMVPTAGLPPELRNWSEYTWLVNQLTNTGFIHSTRELWWDVRPHQGFGTVEVRVCDLPKNLEHALSITALIQSLVVSISRQLDDGAYPVTPHPMMTVQNKWLAARLGARAMLVDADSCLQHSVQQGVDSLVDRLLPIAESLGCVRELTACRRIPGATGAEQQLELYASSFSRRHVVAELLATNAWPSK
jgi:carboxylate-amine ligase